MLQGALPLHAQMADTIAEVTVYSSRLDQSAGESGRSITILDKKYIQELPVESIDQLLRYVPGIEVQSRGLFGTQSDFSLRGSTFSQVLVMVDGMKVNNPLTAHFNASIPIPLSEIERVEILRGPATAIFGPDAVGGVVNIITKTFTRRIPGNKIASTGKVILGENKLISANAGVNIYKNDWTFSLGMENSQSEGQRLETGTRNDFIVRQMGIATGKNFGNGWYAAIRSTYDYRTFDARYFYTVSPFDKSKEETRGWWNQLKISREKNGHQTSLLANYNSSRDSFLFNPMFPANIHTMDYLNFQVNHMIKISKKTRLTLGAQADRRSIESTDRGNHQDDHAGVYLIHYWSPFSLLGFTTSARADYDENYGYEFLPQLNISYSPGRLTFRGMTGRSIRAADYTERYISTNLQSTLSPGRNIGNPNLKAEKAWNYEIGIDYSLNKKITLNTTGFYRKSRDLIDYALVQGQQINSTPFTVDTAYYFHSMNLKELNTYGIESILTINRELGTVHLNGSVGYSYIEATNDEDIVGKYISAHAKHLVSGNLTFGYKSINLSLTSLYKKRDPEKAEAINSLLAEDYLLWNGRLEVGMPGENLFLFGQLYNMFDITYHDFLGVQLPRRWLMFGLRWDVEE